MIDDELCYIWFGRFFHIIIIPRVSPAILLETTTLVGGFIAMNNRYTQNRLFEIS